MAKEDWTTNRLTLAKTVVEYINEGPRCAVPECGEPRNYHASTKQDGVRDGGCRVEPCPCVGYKLP